MGKIVDLTDYSLNNRSLADDYTNSTNKLIILMSVVEQTYKGMDALV